MRTPVTTSAPISFDVELFRAQFPAFANTTTYPDILLEMYFANATCYIEDYDSCTLAGNCRLLALNQMTAHLTALADDYNAGQLSGVPTAATVDKVSVTLLPPPVTSEWGWWLTQTPYGQQLLALLQSASCTVFVVGARNEQQGFRKIGGVF